MEKVSRRCARAACKNKFDAMPAWRRYCTDACSIAVRQARFWKKKLAQTKIGGTI